MKNHQCRICGKGFCKCHHNPRYKYPDYVPEDYEPIELVVLEALISDELDL